MTGLQPDEAGASVERGDRKRKCTERHEPEPGEKMDKAKCGRVKGVLKSM